MTLHWTQLSTPAAHDHSSLHAPDVCNFSRPTAHDYQQMSWAYGAQEGTGYAINTRGAAYPENTFPYNENADMSTPGNYRAYHPELNAAPESLHSMNSSSSPHSMGTPLARMDQREIDRNLFTNTHLFTTPHTQHTTDAYYGNNNDAFVDAGPSAEGCWELSGQRRTTDYGDSSYYSSQDDYALATPFTDAYTNPTAPTNDHSYASTTSQFHGVGRMAVERVPVPQSRSRINTQSPAQPDSFYGSYGSKGSLVHPTPFMSGQHFTEPDQRLCSPLVAANHHALAPGPDYHAYPPPSQHQPVPINHHSSYSELSANVAYISQTTPSTSQASLSSSSRRETPASKAFQDLRSWPPEVVPSRHRTSSVRFEHDVRDQTSGTQHLVQVLPWSEPESLSGSEVVPKLKKGTEKKQTLACLFCRERKIACGRPAEGSDDHTCNQCARRFFTCEYPTQSRRGQHKRGRRKPHDVNDGT